MMESRYNVLLLDFNALLLTHFFCVFGKYETAEGDTIKECHK